MRVIGFTGYATAGKDTAAAALVAEGWEQLSFADALKRLARLADPDMDLVVKTVGWETAKREPWVRQFLQHLGIGCREVFGPDVWVNVLKQLLLDNATSNKSFVISDVRFPNEIDMIDIWSGDVFRITRPGCNAVNQHISETALDNYDLPTIDNDGTVAELHRKVLEVVGL